MALTVTFDTNTFDKVSRPALYSRDVGYAEMIEVHDALKRAAVREFIRDTALTLEGIGVDHRVTVFGERLRGVHLLRCRTIRFRSRSRPSSRIDGPFIPNKPSVSAKRSLWASDCWRSPRRNAEGRRRILCC